MITQINDNILEERVIESEEPICIIFLEYSSRMHKEFMPMMESVAEQLTDKVKFYKIIATEHPTMVRDLKIKETPTVLIYWDGECIAKYKGMHSGVELYTKIKEAIGKKQ